jgi:hypothetical protein
MAIVSALIAGVVGVTIARYTIGRTLEANQKLADTALSRTAVGDLLKASRTMHSASEGDVFNGNSPASYYALQRWEAELELRGRLVMDKDLLGRLDRYTRDLQELHDLAKSAHFGRARLRGIELQPGQFDLHGWAEKTAPA